jgi:hypothetical protein
MSDINLPQSATTTSNTPAFLADIAVVKPSLAGLSRTAMAERLGEIGVPVKEQRMRVAQLWHWIYVRGFTTFDEMTDVSKQLRAELAESFSLARPLIVSEQVSKDGTRKWLIKLPSTGKFDRGAEVEVVYIPESERGTLCVSSQVGCTLNCSFCHTGTKTGSQSNGCGNCLSSFDRAGLFKRLPRQESSRWRFCAARQQPLCLKHRLHGYGRTAL